MSLDVLLISSWMLPLFAGLAVLLCSLSNRRKHRAGIKHLFWAGALPGIITALVVPIDHRVTLQGVLLGLEFKHDFIAHYFLLLTSSLWGIAGIYCCGYFATDKRSDTFLGFYLLTMSGNIGACLSFDLPGFYTFFVLMSLASYALIVHERSNEALRAGLVYLVMVILSEVFLFTALVLIAFNMLEPTFDTIAIVMAHKPLLKQLATTLVVLGFGIKAGVWFLHFWLPLAHPAAPIPASAVLSGAIIKAGILGWLRFIPWDQSNVPILAVLLLAAGIIATLVGALIGITQRNPKAVLAYSSISQMGLITVIISLMMARIIDSGVGLSVTIAYTIHHGLAKCALFLSVGIISMYFATYKARLAILGCIALIAMVLAGAPFTSGSLIKSSLAATALEITPIQFGELLHSFFYLSAVTTTLLLGRFIFLCWGTLNRKNNHRNKNSIMIASWLLASGLSLACVYLIQLRLLPTHAPWQQYTLTNYLWSSSWPIMLACIIISLTWSSSSMSKALHQAHIPPGDMLSIFERYTWFFSAVITPLHSLWTWCYQPRLKKQWSISLAKSGNRYLTACETYLTQWTIGTLLILMIIAIVAAAMIL